MLYGILSTPILAHPAMAELDATYRPLQFATGWLGQRPPSSSLRGRVVLIDIFTFECINCVNVTPNLKRLYAEYSRSEFEIVGVHTPEVPSYQSSLAYLSRQTNAAELPWPIAIDNHHRIWEAYGVSAWPTQLLFDRQGRLRATIVGDGQDAKVASAVRALVRSG
jgi:thiol-disulfide isomerase/thioredoxin